MFLSMLVAWMIPDVPRSLREQLKKENMMLMEFLLNQDQEAQAKSQSQKGPNPCFPASIDIIVEAPANELEEEEEAPEEVEVILNELRSSRDSDPEVDPSSNGTGSAQEEQGGKESDGTGAADEEEKGEDPEELNERVEGSGAYKNEDDEEERGEIKELEEFTVDLDSFMSELGLLGETYLMLHHLSTFSFSFNRFQW